MTAVAGDFSAVLGLCEIACRIAEITAYPHAIPSERQNAMVRSTVDEARKVLMNSVLLCPGPKGRSVKYWGICIVLEVGLNVWITSVAAPG